MLILHYWTSLKCIVVSGHVCHVPSCRVILNCLFPPQAHDRGLHSKGVINCAGYRALTSMEEYLGLLNNSLSGEK